MYPGGRFWSCNSLSAARAIAFLAAVVLVPRNTYCPTCNRHKRMQCAVWTCKICCAVLICFHFKRLKRWQCFTLEVSVF